MKKPALLAVLGLFASISAGAATPNPPAPAKPTVLKPGKPLEKCMALESGQRVQYEFNAPVKINFHLRYNKGDQAYYPVKLDRTLGESGVYESRARERYCLSWENRTDADVELNYSIKTLR